MITILFTAFIISFLGQLPLGSMSMTATQIRVQEGLSAALLYMWGVVIVEMIYLRIALTGMDWIFSHPTFFNILGWITVVFFIVF
ncbi:MAG: LysE family transporter [Chitinophagaceae bacterium]